MGAPRLSALSWYCTSCYLCFSTSRNKILQSSTACWFIFFSFLTNVFFASRTKMSNPSTHAYSFNSLYVSPAHEGCMCPLVCQDNDGILVWMNQPCWKNKSNAKEGLLDKLGREAQIKWLLFDWICWRCVHDDRWGVSGDFYHDNFIFMIIFIIALTTLLFIILCICLLPYLLREDFESLLLAVILENLKEHSSSCKTPVNIGKPWGKINHFPLHFSSVQWLLESLPVNPPLYWFLHWKGSGPGFHTCCRKPSHL